MKHSRLQKISALLLLVAYLPLVGASVLHHHDPRAWPCADCRQHAVHAAHLAPASVEAGCVICNALGQTYLPQQQEGLPLPPPAKGAACVQPRCAVPVCAAGAAPSLRAPPAC